MALIIEDPRIEQLVDQLAETTGETRLEALRHALEAHCGEGRGAAKVTSRTEKLRRYLEDVVWPDMPPQILGKGLSKAEREEILGSGQTDIQPA